MAVGSICFVLALAKLPVGMAAAISTSYVLLVVLLSRIFLNETISWMKKLVMSKYLQVGWLGLKGRGTSTV